MAHQVFSAHQLAQFPGQLSWLALLWQPPFH